DVLRSQRNPIFKVDVAILKNTNFFRAFMTYSSSPIIYIQQFWDTMRPRHLVLQILWVIIHCSNINYAERIWEEFVQSIQSFFTDKKRLTMPSQGKKKVTPLLIPGIRFTKLFIHYLKTKNNIHPRTGSPLHYSHADNVLGNLKFIGNDGREVYGMPILDALLTDAILGPPYYEGYLAYVAEYQRYLDGKHGMVAKEAVPESSA
nr:hypothetical protein [Tanacetum cinerariifolium]